MSEPDTDYDITLYEVLRHLNIEDVAEDGSGDADFTILQNKLDAAKEWIGQFIGTPLYELTPLPYPLREAVLQLVGHFYENREATLVGVSAQEIPFGVYDLVAPYREYVF